MVISSVVAGFSHSRSHLESETRRERLENSSETLRRSTRPRVSMPPGPGLGEPIQVFVLSDVLHRMDLEP